jgi:hypothetical protein
MHKPTVIDWNLEARTANERQLTGLRTSRSESLAPLELGRPRLAELHVALYPGLLLPFTNGVTVAIRRLAFAQVSRAAEGELGGGGHVERDGI